MNRSRTTISLLKKAAGIFLVLTLLWLTVSTPFVYAGGNMKKDVACKHTGHPSQDDDSPFSGTTEEKSESGFNTISEYLLDLDQPERSFTFITSFYKCHPADLYFAFHPELLSPPPEA